MEKRIRIRLGDLSLEARLNDTPVAGMIWDALPITASVDYWGDEIYFPYSSLIESLVFSRRLDSFLL